MKTSEFRKKLNQYYSLYIGENDKSFKISQCGGVLIEISKTHTGRILIYSMCLRDLVDTCIEYAETPLEEREEVKRYIVILPDPERIGKRVYALGKNLGEVIIRNVQRERLNDPDMYHLTESEIKRNHEYLWQFAKEVTE